MVTHSPPADLRTRRETTKRDLGEKRPGPRAGWARRSEGTKMEIKESVQQAKKFLLGTLWELELATLGRARRSLYHALRVACMVFRGFLTDRCLLRASALSYLALLSLVPLLAVAFSILTALGVQNILEEEFLPAITAPPAQEILRYAIDFTRNGNANALGLLGVGALILTAITVLGNVERAFNDIWGVKRPRNFFRKFTDYLSVLIVGPLLAALALTFTASLQSNYVVKTLGLTWLMNKLLDVVPYLFLWLMLTSVYSFLPNTKVRFRAALTGGVVAGTLWQIAQWGYVKFQVAAGYRAVYASFAQFPIFLVWVYICWVIILFGAEISFACQNVQTYRLAGHAPSASFAAKETLALRAAIAISSAFHSGERIPSAEELSASWSVSIRLLNAVLAQLEARGLLSRMSGDTLRYQPAKVLAKISVNDVLEAIRQHGDHLARTEGGPEKEYVQKLISRRQQLTGKEIGSVNMQEIVLELEGQKE